MMNQQVMYVDTIRTGAEARVAGLTDYGELYGTEIGDGDSDFMKRLRTRQFGLMSGDPLKRSRVRIIQFCRQVRDTQSHGSFQGYEMSESDIGVIMTLFDQSTNRQYKHPVLFVLGYVMSSLRGHRSLEIAMVVAKRTNQHWVREVDIIRYYRHLRLQSQRH